MNFLIYKKFVCKYDPNINFFRIIEKRQSENENLLFFLYIFASSDLFIFEPKLNGKIETAYVYQSLDKFTNHYPTPTDRTKHKEK